MYIKELLSIKGITQKELAERMGVSLSAVKQMVAAKSITTATLSKIAIAMECEMWEFFIDPKKRERTGTLRCPKCGVKLVLTAEE